MKIASCISIFICFVCFASFKPQVAVREMIAADSSAVKKVFLMRHAKSSHDDPNQNDFDRTLDPKGKKEAAEMGQYLVSTGEHFDLVVASPSVRTRETATIVCEKLGYDLHLVKWDSTIYRCSKEAFVDCIKKTDNRYKTVLFIGHNNAITEVANVLQQDEKIADVPTAGVVAIAFRTSNWDAIALEKGKLLFYKSPK